MLPHTLLVPYAKDGTLRPVLGHATGQAHQTKDITFVHKSMIVVNEEKQTHGSSSVHQCHLSLLLLSVHAG